MHIKVIAFDLDGTLVDLCDMHYYTLNFAINLVAGEQYAISREMHETEYNGLPTKVKLAKLSRDLGLPESLHGPIDDLKQDVLFTYAIPNIEFDKELYNSLEKLDIMGFRMYVASNAIGHTVESVLWKLKIDHFFEKSFSNQDVKNPKPSPDIYNAIVEHAGVSPDEVLAIEDSSVGIESCSRAGVNWLRVDSPKDVRWDRIMAAIGQVEDIYEKY